jgi:hypothetical protein
LITRFANLAKTPPNSRVTSLRAAMASVVAAAAAVTKAAQRTITIDVVSDIV